MTPADNRVVEAVTQEDRARAYPFRGMIMASDCGEERWNAGEFDDSAFVQAFARHRRQAAERERAEMPTIWEDPAGKGYPCFERPMTAKEACEAIDRLSQRIIELEEVTAIRSRQENGNG